MLKENNFLFCCVDKDVIFEEILSLENTKACQTFDIPSKVVKENPKMLTNYLLSGFNNSIAKSGFSAIF